MQEDHPPSLFPQLEQAINRHPLVVAPDDLVIDVIIKMSNNHNSCALVVAQQELLGILTEWDIVKLTAAQTSLVGLTAKEVMTTKPITLNLKEIDNIFALLSRWRHYRIRHLPITDENKQLVGVITPQMIQQQLNPMDLLKLRKVAEVMTTDVLHVTQDVSVLEIAQLMTTRQVRCIVITQTNIQGQIYPLGMITERNLLEFSAQTLDFSQVQVQQIMNSSIITVLPEESLWNCHQLMQNHHLRRLIVVDEAGYLVGIVAQSNIMAVLEPMGMYSTLEALQTLVEEKNTELLKTNAMLREEIAERRQLEVDLNRFFNLSQDMFYIVGFDGYFKRLNPSWEKLLGFSEAEILSQPFLELVHPEDQERVAREVRKLVDGEKTISFESRYSCKDGSYCWFLWTATPFREQKLIYGIAHDITQRREDEQQLKQINADLTRSNQELEQFAYFASHDLQEPLRKIKSYSDLLVKRYGEQFDERADRYIAYISDGVSRMQALIRDLLTYSRVSTTKPVFKPVQLNLILRAALNDLSSVIEENHAEIVTEFLPTVNAHPGMLSQLLQNLIANGIKFCRSPSPRIHISATENDQFWTIAIQDNGIGIDSEQKERIFALFGRLHFREEYPGTGIGLTLCKKIVELHGGEIWFDSTVGEGTTFYFTLPKT